MVGVDGVAVAVVVASRHPAVTSTVGARGRLASGSRVVPRAASLQDPIRRVGGVALFRAVEGAEWPNLARFFSGPYLTERSILARPDFESGHVNPGGSGRVPGRSGPKRMRPNTNLRRKNAAGNQSQITERGLKGIRFSQSPLTRYRRLFFSQSHGVTNFSRVVCRLYPRPELFDRGRCARVVSTVKGVKNKNISVCNNEGRTTDH